MFLRFFAKLYTLHAFAAARKAINHGMNHEVFFFKLCKGDSSDCIIILDWEAANCEGFNISTAHHTLFTAHDVFVSGNTLAKHQND